MSTSLPRSPQMYAAKELWTWGFLVEDRFRHLLRLWKSIWRATLQPFSKRRVQARRRPRIIDRGYA